MKSAKKSLNSTKKPFHWRHVEGEIILLTVRWTCSYGLSYRNLIEMMDERGFNLALTTIMRWVHEYAPQIDKKIRPYLKRTYDSWRVDETYIKVKGNRIDSVKLMNESKTMPIDIFAPEPRDRYHFLPYLKLKRR